MCNSYDGKQQIIAFPSHLMQLYLQLQTSRGLINTIHFNYCFEHEPVLFVCAFRITVLYLALMMA